MSLWSWFTGSNPPTPTSTPIEPRMSPPVDAREKINDLIGGLNSFAFPQGPIYPGFYGSNTGIPVTPYTALQAPAVYACCRCIAEDIAGLNLQIRRRLRGGGWIVDYDHPLNKVLRRPNEWQSRFQFWTYACFVYSLRGNSYIYVDRNTDGQPFELIPVMPDRCSMQYGRNGSIWYLINAPRRDLMGVWVPPEDMMHVKNLSIDGLTGLSPITLAQEAIGLALGAQQHGAVLFRQGGQIAGVLKHPGKLGTEGVNNIQQSWQQQHSGVQNAFKAAVLEEGMSFERIGITNEESQYLQTRQFQVTDICRIFRVPPHKVADYGRATFNNIEHQQQQYIDDCLMSLTDQLENLMDDHLFFDDERDTYETHFDFSSMLRGDRLKRYQGHQIGLNNGFLSRNEVRADEGLNPIPGGDEYRVPLNTGDPTNPANEAQRIPTGDGDGGGDDEREDDE